MIKNLPTNARDTQTWVPCLGQEDPLEKEVAAHSVFLPGRCHGQRSLMGYSPWGHRESDMTQWVNISNAFPVPWLAWSNYWSFFFFKYIWLHQVSVVSWGIFHCGMWDLVPQPGIKPGPLPWELRVPATGSPRKSLKLFVFTQRTEVESSAELQVLYLVQGWRLVPAVVHEWLGERAVQERPGLGKS